MTAVNAYQAAVTSDFGGEAEPDFFFRQDATGATELHKAQFAARHHFVNCRPREPGDLRPLTDLVGNSAERLAPVPDRISERATL